MVLRQEKVKDRSGRKQEPKGKGTRTGQEGQGEGREVGCRKSWLCLRGSSTAPPKGLIDVGKDRTDAAVELNRGVLSTVLYLPLLDARPNNHLNQKRHSLAGVSWKSRLGWNEKCCVVHETVVNAGWTQSI